MPRAVLLLKWLKIAACGGVVALLSSGCELVVGELPQAVDSDGGVKMRGEGASNGNGVGGNGTGGVAISYTSGGASGRTSSGGSSADGGAANGGTSPESGGRPPVSDGGATATGGRATGSGGQVVTGGASSSGSPGTGGGTASGGSGGCQNPCDCDGDSGVAVSCGGDDCDDGDPLVYKGEPTYYPTASLHHGFDYDCNSTLDVEPAVNKIKNCSLLNLTDCDTVSQGFLAGVVPPCGASADWGTCMKGLVCGDRKLGSQQVTCK